MAMLSFLTSFAVAVTLVAGFTAVPQNAERYESRQHARASYAAPPR
jgi:hypothetical protein